MTDWFAFPQALWAALLFAPLILLYLLRHRPVRRRVPSVALWAGIADAQISTSPFQRLRKSISLLLMCLALLALILALAGLRIPHGRERGLPLTIVLDTTASMAANHAQGTRMDAAVEIANAAIQAAGSSPITVLAWDGALRPIGPAEGSPADARVAIAGLQTVQHGSDDRALATALDQLRQTSHRIVLISDATDRQRDAIMLQAGEAAWNAGIVSAGVGESAPGQPEIFLGVESFGDGPSTVAVALERVTADGLELLDARDVALDADRRAAFRFRAPGPGLYRGVLRTDDALSLDNHAYVRVVTPPPLAVSMDESVPAAVRRALSAIEQGMGTIRVVADAADSYVFADAASAGAQPRLPSAFLGPHAHPPRAGFDDVMTPPAITANVLPGMLWRGTQAPEIAVARLWPLDVQALTRPALEVDGFPAVALCDRGNGLQDLVIGLSLEEGDGTFISQTAFVLFWANWFEYVRSLNDPLPNGAVSTRDALRVPSLDGRDPFRVLTPGGAEFTVAPGAAYTAAEIGVHHVRDLETEVPMFGASLLDARESNLAASAFDNEAALAAIRTGAAGGERAALELAPWLALIAAGLLLTEWLLFRRRFPRVPADAAAPPSTIPRTR